MRFPKPLRLVPDPAPTLTPAQVFVRLAARAYIMAVLQAGGVWLIAHGSLLAGVTGFLISYNWAAASQDASLYRIRGSRLAYGAGGSLGTMTVLALARFL